MDMNSVAMQSSIDNDDDVAERMRFESFKLGNASSTTNIKTIHRHARSRSRNLSISSSISSLPFTSSNSTKSTSDTSPDSPTSSHASAASLAAPSSKRGSHHHRRSSVSTRHESADMMGVTVADLSLSSSDDNINLGEKDSVRRRALWALEGKPDHSSFSKVEIPDISTPEINKKFDIPAKPSFPSVVGPAFGGSLNNVPGKRDSFGKHIAASSSSKELLHTLVEEDEEEEEKVGEYGNTVLATSLLEMSPAESPVSAAVLAALSRNSHSRPRPTSLNLRPLALNKENLVIAGGSLPTPSSPTRRSGLRSLTLAPSPNPSSMNQTTNFNATSTAMNNDKRQSLTVSISPQSPSILDFETNFGSAYPISSSDSAKRRSIQYRCSTDHAYGQFTLPTPELTPTLERQRSLSFSSSPSIGDRPLSETEQHFLYEAHAILVQRISDLERALAASQPQSRPTSSASDVSSRSHVSLTFPHPEEPSDEMLQLIADLKAERDELSKDVEGWRVRVLDLDKQVSLFARRVDMERREAWVARERSGLLEIEKRGLEKSLEAKSLELQEALDMCKAAKMECDKVKLECERLKQDLRNKQDVDNECEKLRTVLGEERKKLEKLENSRSSNARIPASADYPPSYSRTIAKRDFSFQSVGSVDSESTDVQDLKEIKINLGPVTEEHENSDEEDELRKYEEEDENDYAYESNRGSSTSSLEDIVQSAPLRVKAPAVPAHTMEPVQGHGRHNSLVKAWSFAHAAPRSSQETEVDKFFGCLEDYDDSASDETSTVLSTENGRSFFTQSLSQHDDGDLPPFLLPKHVGFEIPEEKPVLDAVPEENEEEEPKDTFCEDEFVGEEVEGGVIFKFTLPEDSDASSEVQTPSPGPTHHSPHIFEEEEEQGIVPFLFPKMTAPSTPPPKPISSSLPVKTGDSVSVPQTPIRKSTSPSPSSIPRSVNLRTYTPAKAMPERCVITRTTVNTAFVTPPTNCGGTMPPTFIPQPRGRPVSPMSPPGARPVSQRANAVPSLTKLVTQPSAPSTNTSSTTHRYEDTDVLNSGPILSAGSQFPQNIIHSSTNGTKLSFQSFTNLIPSAFSWSPRAVQKVDVPASVQVAEPPALFSIHSGNRKVEKRCYVSKEKQLEKLRSFLAEQERVRRNGID